MRVLTVRQPWAEAIIFGGKDIENRPRNIAGAYRGPVAIHSGLHKPTSEEWKAFEAAHPAAMSRMAHTIPWGQEEFGVILGVVDLTDVHFTLLKPRRARRPSMYPCSEWAQPEAAVHIRLANPRPLRDPIPFQGALGLRRLDEATIARIQEGMAS